MRMMSPGLRAFAASVMAFAELWPLPKIEIERTFASGQMPVTPNALSSAPNSPMTAVPWFFEKVNARVLAGAATHPPAVKALF